MSSENARTKKEYYEKTSKEGWRTFTLRLCPLVSRTLEALSSREYRNFRGVVESALVEHSDKAYPGLTDLLRGQAGEGIGPTKPTRNVIR